MNFKEALEKELENGYVKEYKVGSDDLDIIPALKLEFQRGAEWAKHFLAKEPGLRWVKASETPKKADFYCTKRTYTNSFGETFINYTGTWYDKNGWRDMLMEEKPEQFKWLEEHPDKEGLREKEEPLPDEAVDWISVDTEPEFGGEYNVLYDLEDGGKPMVSTMDYDKNGKKWYDTRGANIVCDTVLMWRELPQPPTI